MEERVYNELLIELECPICMNYMSPPIYQCAVGHNICETCRKKLSKCALCLGRFTESRNISLEGLAVKMLYPCINKSSGCTAKLSYTERRTHELRCTLKGYKCPLEKCTWTGKYEDISAHWASKKMTSKPYTKSNVCHTKLKSGSYYVNMITAYNRLFWFKCKVVNNKFYWSVQYIGNAAEAENYYYEIEIVKPGRSKQKILVSDYCQSIDLENSQLFKDDMCLSIHAESVKSFISEDQLLIYFMRVYQVKESVSHSSHEGVKQTNPEKSHKQRARSKGPMAQSSKEQNKHSSNIGKRQNKHSKEGFVIV